jgi:GTP-binding protein
MKILEAKYLISSPSVEQSPKPDRPEYAFIGRSNVGKSSLINMLCNNSKLAKTSSTPGKTQLINHFEITSLVNSKKTTRQKWYLVDLPGYGFAKVSQKERKTWEKMIEGYIRHRTNLVTVFILVDSRHEPQQIDIDFVNQLGEWHLPFAIVFTKADKNKPMATQRNTNAFLEELNKTWESLPKFFISSAITRQGSDEIIDYIGELNNKLLV